MHFHAFTSDTLATVSLYDYETAEPGTRRLMRLRLQKPIVLVPGDHFVLRQCSPASTIGGGRVLDAHPLPNLRKAKCLAWLETFRDASPEEQLLLRVARRGIAGLTTRELMAETGLTREALERFAEPFVSSNHLLRIPGDMLLSSEAAESAIAKLASHLRDGRKERRPQAVRVKEPNRLGMRRSSTSLSETLAREQKNQAEGRANI